MALLTYSPPPASLTSLNEMFLIHGLPVDGTIATLSFTL